MGVAKADSHWYAKTPPELLGSLRTTPWLPATSFRAGRFTRRLGRNRAELIDDGLDALPFDPDGTIEIPGLNAAEAQRDPT